MAAMLGLGVDEAHYVMYSLRPDWGYFDHPPMVAYLALLTRPFGNHPFWIRLGPVLCSALSMLLLRYLAKVMGYGERTSFFAVVTLNLMPGFHLIAPALLPDATLNVFWLLTLIAAWTALQTGKFIPWTVTGMAFGLAMLSKYHGVLLPLCLALFVLTTPRYRHWIFRPHAYLAGIFGLLLFSPNIIWNAKNNWISYAYQLAHGGGTGPALTDVIGKLFEAVGGQMAFAGPVLMVMLPAAAWSARRDSGKNPAERYLICTSIPVFVFFCFIGAFGKILPHWTFAGWWAGCLLVGAMLDRYLDKAHDRRRWRRAWWAALATSGPSIVIMYIALFSPLIPRLYHAAEVVSHYLSHRFDILPRIPPYEAKFDISNDLYGWEKIADEAARIHRNQPYPEHTFLFSHRFYTASQIAVHLPESITITTLSRRQDQYRLWFDPVQHRGWDAVFIDHERYGQGFERYRRLFDEGDDKPVEFTVRRGRFPAHRVRFFRYSGYKGGCE